MASLASKMHAAALAGVSLGGCTGVQSALDPAGPEAQAVAHLTWILFAGAGAIVLLVGALTAYAVFRSPQKRRPVAVNAFVVGGGIVFPSVVLSALLLHGIPLMGELRGADADALQVHVTGHMWWWDVRYRGADGESIATANELVIPVGRPVKVTLASADVIHSFWVPRLAGKLDAIPGRQTALTLRADRPGVYRGQCAEFCGAQHALMAFHVIALPPDEFERRLQQLRAPARAPSGDEALAGRAAFLTHGCGNCHTVRGLVDGRVAAPDLTHVGSRGWVGGGALRNTPDNLVTWLAHGDQVKPERAMPSFAHLEPATLAAIARFLTGLQ